MLPSLPAAKNLESNDFHIFAVAFEAMHLLEDLPAALRSAKNDKSSPVDKWGNGFLMAAHYAVPS